MTRVLCFCLLALVASVVKSAPCAPAAPTRAPCVVPRTTKAPCVPRATTTTTTTTTTTPVPCETTTVALNPCETTTIAFNPCETTTAAFNPCRTTTTTTTPAPCETTTVALNPCATTTEAPNPCGTTAPVVYYSAPPKVHDEIKNVVKETNKDGINWKPYDANRLKKEEGIQIDPPVVHTFDGEYFCRDGWTRFKESCYYVEREEKKSLRNAEQHCRELSSTLFVPNSVEEFQSIFQNAPVNTWTWLGLRKENEHQQPHWHVSDALDLDKLNWLNNSPYGDAINGWTSVSQCAAHWNPFTSLGKYSFFYPCNYSFHYVCERNSTLVSSIDGFF